MFELSSPLPSKVVQRLRSEEGAAVREEQEASERRRKEATKAWEKTK